MHPSMLPTAQLLLEYDPGHFVDLAQILEINDLDEVCYLVTAAPTAFGKGPHLVTVTGEARRLALGYARARAAGIRALLEQIADTHADDIAVPITIASRVAA